LSDRTFGRYRIVEALGEGGMGVVYRAEDPRLERTVAIKVLRPDTIRDATAQERFRQEARALSRLLHPNIATLFDFDTQDGIEFLVLESCARDRSRSRARGRSGSRSPKPCRPRTNTGSSIATSSRGTSS
jgi:serine/threonine protein kinase